MNSYGFAFAVGNYVLTCVTAGFMYFGLGGSAWFKTRRGKIVTCYLLSGLVIAWVAGTSPDFDNPKMTYEVALYPMALGVVMFLAMYPTFLYASVLWIAGKVKENRERPQGGAS